MTHLLVGAAVVVAVYFLYEHYKSSKTVAAIKAELVKIEGEAVTDVKAVIARIRKAL